MTADNRPLTITTKLHQLGPSIIILNRLLNRLHIGLQTIPGGTTRRALSLRKWPIIAYNSSEAAGRLRGGESSGTPPHRTVHTTPIGSGAIRL